MREDDRDDGRRARSGARTPTPIVPVGGGAALEGVGKVLTGEHSTWRPLVGLRALTSGPVVRQELPRSTSDTTAMVQLCGRWYRGGADGARVSGTFAGSTPDTHSQAAAGEGCSAQMTRVCFCPAARPEAFAVASLTKVLWKEHISGIL